VQIDRSTIEATVPSFLPTLSLFSLLSFILNNPSMVSLTEKQQSSTTWVQSTEWVNFSKDYSSEKTKQSLKELVPPTLTLPIQHYCMIAEKVFISFLKSYRKLYVDNDEAAMEKAHVLGKRLEAFLNVVLPSHTDYGSSRSREETSRINEIGRQLEDYLGKLQGEKDHI